MSSYDEILVVGGGPAGLAAAIAARQRGFTVTVVDVSRPPIDKACGEGIMPDGLAAARALGIELDSAAAQRFRGVRFCDGDASVEAVLPGGPGVGMRRTALHQLLVERAEAAGVHFRWGTRISGLAELRARWVIGADGGQSRVRRWAGLEASDRNSRRFGFRRHYPVAPWTDYMEVHWAEVGQIYITPVASDEICVALISRDPHVRLDDALLQFPRVAERLGVWNAVWNAARRRPLELGGVSATRRLKRVTKGNVALVGDAAGSVDAITGEGLCLLFQQARALADAFETGDLRGYETAHRRIARRPEFMADLMLLLDGRSRLRRCAIRTMAFEPRLFQFMLAAHMGGV